MLTINDHERQRIQALHGLDPDRDQVRDGRVDLYAGFCLPYRSTGGRPSI
jgi:hypothetical protein